MLTIHTDVLDHLRRTIDGDVRFMQPPRALTGGFVTDVYLVQLENVPSEWSKPLVLRVYPARTEPLAVRRERCAQEVVSTQGLPAPRVLMSEDTGGVVGRPFMIMEYKTGRPQMVIEFPQLLLEAPRLFTLARRHAAAMDALHRLDAEPLLRSFEAAGIDRRSAGPEHWLDVTETSIDRWGLDSLRPGLDWLRSNRPNDPPTLSICHGDLFGANILESRGRMTGIIDWNLVTVGDPAFDVGGQIAAYEMSAVPGPRVVQAGAIGFGKLLARGLRQAYQRLRELSEESLRYYAAMRAFTEMGHKLAALERVRTTGVSERMPTWRPEQCARYFTNRAGVHIEID